METRALTVNKATYYLIWPKSNPNDYTVEVRNRFKGLDLIDRVPDELWTEVRDIVQETGSKIIPKKKKCKKAKWPSEEALQIAVKRREAKGKGEKERYTHLNAEFQRIARRDEKAFLSDQCKEIEENNRMGKTRDLFKKIRDTKGTFHEKMGSIKERNGMDLTEAEDMKKRWQEYIEELHKKDLHDPDNHEGVITHTHLEPEVWSQVGLRKHHCEQSYWRWWNSSWVISNPERWCCESAALNMPANLENSAVAIGPEKVHFHSNPKERQCKRMLKLLHNCTHLTR